MTTKASMATPQTLTANAAIADQLPLGRAQDARDAERGWLASLTEPVIRADGGVAWDPA